MENASTVSYDYLYNMSPLLIQVELTEACNLKCRFCYNSQKPRYNTRVFEMLDRLAMQGVMQINLTGGEPLMHPDFFNILNYACDRFPNVVLLSNGSLMNEENLIKIHKTSVTSVNISIHGNPQSHDLLTQTTGSYDKSMFALKYFIDKGKILVASNFVLNTFNLSILPETIDYLESIGLQYMTITRFIPVGIGTEASDLILSHSQLIEAFQIAYDHNNSGRKPHIEFAEATPFCALPKHLQTLANCCSYGYDRFYVNVEGELLVCGLSRIKLGGNILEENINDIKKKSDVYYSFIKNLHVPSRCTCCNLFSLCHGGCRAAALSSGEWKGRQDFNMPDYILNLE